MREIPFTLIRGFCMGAADIVPGVSGGTVALVFGIYERLINAIRSGSSAMGRFLRGDFAGGNQLLKEIDWLFLVPLLAGIGGAVLALASILEELLHDHPEQMAGLFLGLVVGSAVVAWQLLGVRDGRIIGTMVGVGVVVFLVLGLREGTSEETVSQAADPALWAFFFAGAIAICAMILPGISGSFLLVTMGMYGAVLGAISDRDLATIAVFGVGCIVGLALFSQVLHWAMSNYYDPVMAALIGLMIGSLRVLWPWPLGVDSTRLALPGDGDPVVLPIVLALIGFVVVIGINEISKAINRRSSTDEADEVRRA